MNDKETQDRNNKFMDKIDFRKTAHPCLIMFDLIFKGTPIAIYWLAFLFTNSLVIQISSISIIAAIDFWFTKNILGRELVGLRWGRVISEDGEETYVYETKGKEHEYHGADKRFFWGDMVIATLFWAVMLVLNLLSITKVMIILVPFVLCGFNLYSFYKCSKEAQVYTKGYIDKQSDNMKRQAINTAVNNYDRV